MSIIRPTIAQTIAATLGPRASAGGMPWSEVGGGGAVVNTVAPVLGGATYAGGSPAVTVGTWSGSPTLTYSLEVNGVEVVSGTEQQIEAYVYVLGDEGYNAILYEIPNGNAGAQVASNTVAINLATRLIALATAASATWQQLSLARREALDLSGADWLDVSGNARTLVKQGAGTATWSNTALDGAPGISADGSVYFETAAAFDASPATKLAQIALALDTTATAYVLAGFGSTQTEAGTQEIVPNTSAGTVDCRARGNVGLTAARTNAQTLAAAKSVAVTTDFGLATNECVAYVNGADDTASRPSNPNNTGAFASHKISALAREAGSLVAPSGTVIAVHGLLSGSVDASLIASIDAAIRAAWGVA
jgi:hypothetical protein